MDSSSIIAAYNTIKGEFATNNDVITIVHGDWLIVFMCLCEAEYGDVLGTILECDSYEIRKGGGVFAECDICRGHSDYIITTVIKPLILGDPYFICDECFVRNTKRTCNYAVINDDVILYKIDERVPEILTRQRTATYCWAVYATERAIISTPQLLRRHFNVGIKTREASAITAALVCYCADLPGDIVTIIWRLFIALE